MGYNRKGFTLIELIMAMVTIGVLSACGAYLMVYVIQHSVFIPNQLNMNMMAEDAMDIMIEGDNQAPGLRFSRQITVAQAYQVTYIYQDQLGINHTVVLQYNPVTFRLSRSIDGVSSTIPYYIKPGTSLLVTNNRLFTYYNSSENSTATPANVRWIEMTLIARTGAGSYANWEGQSEQMTSVAVKKFQ